MKFIRLFTLTVLMSVPILFIACKKTTQIGQNVLPAGDFVNSVSTDTMTVLSQEELELPVPTNSLSNYLLGSMRDPIFGTSYAAIFTQVELPGGVGSTDVTFPDSLIIDSMVLTLPFYTAPAYYGIQNIPQTIRVYRVTQNMLSATTYNSNQAFSYDPTPIGVKTFLPNVVSYGTNKQIVLGDTLVPPQLRIKLSNAFVQDIMSQSANGGGSQAFANNTAFQNFLNGLLISPDTSTGFGGGIMYLNMTDPNAGIVVYGKKGKIENQVDTSVFHGFFPINSSSNVTTGYYKHNYTGTPIQTVLNKDSATNSVLYLQSMGGLRAKITIPHLQNLGKNILINKAQLEIVQVDPQSFPIIDTNFSAPGAIEVLTDSLNTNYSLEDISNEFLTYGGTEIKVSPTPNDTLAEYDVSLSDQIQYLLTGNPTGSTVNYHQFNSLFLRTFPNPDIADRIVVHGGNAKSSKLVLHLIYTKLK